LYFISVKLFCGILDTEQTGGKIQAEEYIRRRFPAGDSRESSILLYASIASMKGKIIESAVLETFIRYLRYSGGNYLRLADVFHGYMAA